MLRRLIHASDGAEIAEVAMVLPLVFTFLLGIVWFARAFNIYSTIQQAAEQGAVLAARQSCSTCGNSVSSDASVDAAIVAVLGASSIDANQIPAIPNPSPLFCPQPPAQTAGGCAAGPHNVWVCRSVYLNPSALGFGTPPPPQCGTVVTFQYPYQFSLPFTSLNMQQITLNARAQSRMEE
jgi:TadE-like protein